jgi:alkylation response protein AidB-like acyl-CoA dehydrogenase
VDAHSETLLFESLASASGSADDLLEWPAKSWAIVGELGALRWSIDARYGGCGLSGPVLLEHYERLATACLTSCFILSQRDAACRRIRDHGTEELKNELLPVLANGQRFATVGLSHLTTSRQHGAPAIAVHEDGESYVLDGFMPWVTGAAHADYIITGGVLTNGNRQILVVLPRKSAGVTVGPPLNLMALAGSMTAEVRCRDVKLDRRWLLAGPTEQVMAGPTGGTGGLETSCLALGLTGASLDFLRSEAKQRPEILKTVAHFQQSWSQLREAMRTLSQTGFRPGEAATLRARANALVLRATQSALTFAKGAGFLKDHPAQRWARQAMFFLVWSCPRPAAEATLGFLNPTLEVDCLS